MAGMYRGLASRIKTRVSASAHRQYMTKMEMGSTVIDEIT